MSNKLLLLSLLLSFQNSKATIVKIYSWWDYISKEVVKKLEQEKLELDLTVYTSNNQAISRLYSDKEMDFYIVSVLVVDILRKYKVFNNDLLRNISEKRKYIENLNKHKFCIPYLWGPTVFLHNVAGIKNNDIDVGILKGFLSSNIEFNLVDDPAEFYGFINNNSACSDEGKKCLKQEYEFFDNYLTPSSFKKEIPQGVKVKPYIYYGWLGGGFNYNKKVKEKLFIQLPSKVVISQDYLCLSKRSKLSSKTALKFAKMLTNRDSTSLNVRKLGYFSPYKNDTRFLRNDLKGIKKATERKIKKGDYVFIPTINDALFKELNKSWNKIRYEK